MIGSLLTFNNLSAPEERAQFFIIVGHDTHNTLVYNLTARVVSQYSNAFVDRYFRVQVP